MFTKSELISRRIISVGTLATLILAVIGAVRAHGADITPPRVSVIGDTATVTHSNAPGLRLQ